MNTVHVVLARHGESLFNVEERYQGQLDSGLTDRGHDQARQLAAWLQANHPPPDLVLSSDLPRTRDTAAPFLALIGATERPDPRLREVDTGHWSGRSFTEVEAEFPDDVRAAAAGADVRRGDGETFAELRIRVWAAICDGVRELTQRSVARQPVLHVFTHGGPIRVAAAAALGLPFPGHHPMAPPTNCSVTVLKVPAGWPSPTGELGSPGELRPPHSAAAAPPQLVHYNLPTAAGSEASRTE